MWNKCGKMEIKKSSSTLFVKRDKEENPSTSLPPTAVPQQPQKTQTLLPTVVANASATEAELLWTIQTGLQRISNRSCDGLPKLFQSMFPDSAITKMFSMG